MTAMRGRALCGALTACDDRCGLCHFSAEMAGELGPFPGYKKNAEHMLRVMRNHRNAALCAMDGYEKLDVKPLPLDACELPGSKPGRLARNSWDTSVGSGAEARLSQRANDRNCAHGHDWAGHGL